MSAIRLKNSLPETDTSIQREESLVANRDGDSLHRLSGGFCTKRRGNLRHSLCKKDLRREDSSKTQMNQNGECIASDVAAKLHTCSVCKKAFKRRTNLNRHVKLVHKADGAEGGFAKAICHLCDKEFPNRLYRDDHLRIIHGLNAIRRKSSGLGVSRAPSVQCVDCQHTSLSITQYRKHLESDHDVVLSVQTLEFVSFTEFQDWKKSMERDTNSLYVSKRGRVRTTEGYTQTLYCHRSGCRVAVGRGLRVSKKGSRKLDAHCPSAMEITKGADGVKVIFYPTHHGHSLDVEHFPIPKQQREAIARSMKEGVPWEQILDDIKMGSKGNWASCVTRKDLHNIAASYGVYRKNQVCFSDVELASLKEDIEKINSQIMLKVQSCTSLSALKFAVSLLTETNNTLDDAFSDPDNLTRFLVDPDAKKDISSDS